MTKNNPKGLFFLEDYYETVLKKKKGKKLTY